jgi:predicted  nucleic acid-binding Zn-ribbon protein
MEKRCTKCGQTKDVSEFYGNKNAKDGLEWGCKKCKSEQYYKRYKQDPKAILDRNRKYATSKAGIENRSNWIERSKNKLHEYRVRYIHTKKGKEAVEKKIKRYNNEYPEKRYAKEVIHDLVRRGKLPRVNTLTCHRCHVNQAEHYHHPDYSKPMDVIPLCVQCHIDIHNQS